MKPTAVLGRRIVALILDSIILSAINAALFFPFASSDEEIAAQVLAGDLDPNANAYVNVAIGDTTYSLVGGKAALFFLVSFLIGIGYWVVLPGLKGWTPAKAALGLRIVRDDGTMPIGVGRAFIRYIAWLADGFPYIIPGLTGFVVALTNGRRKRIGDMAAGSLVVKAGAVNEAAAADTEAPLEAAPAPVMGTAAMPAIRPAAQPEPKPQPAASGPPADWYPDPKGEKRLRYWDGAAWTEHTAD